MGASVLIVLLATQGSGVAQRTAWSFEDLPAGRPPAGFLFASSPKDQSGQWTVVRDGTNSVLGQLRQGPSGVQLAVAEGPSFADLVLSVRVRLLEGARSAGVVWHYRDADNYYLARLDLQRAGRSDLPRRGGPTDAIGGRRRPGARGRRLARTQSGTPGHEDAVVDQWRSGGRRPRSHGAGGRRRRTVDERFRGVV